MWATSVRDAGHRQPRQKRASFPPMSKIPVIVAAIIVSGFMGLACSSSGLKITAHDAGAVGEDQTGGSISNGSAGGAGGYLGPVGTGGDVAGDTFGPGGSGGSIVAGAGGTIGPVGAGGVSTGGTTGSGRSSGGGGTAGNARTSSSSTGGQGGMSSSSPCLVSATCNVGEIVVAEQGNADLSKDCPAERECYALYNRCASALCVLPEGVHCTDELTCNPGDIEESLDACAQKSTDCYNKQLCTRTIYCKYATDAGVAAFSSDAAVGGDAMAVGYCGDGIVQADLGEQCDWSAQNGELQVGYICTRSCQLVPYLP